MDVALDIVRHVVIDHIIHIVNVKSSSCNISGNQNFGAIVLKIIQIGISLTLVKVTIEDWRFDIVIGQ